MIPGPTANRRPVSRRNVLGLGALAALGATPRTGFAQAGDATWPTRTVRFIVPSGPGSGADIPARLWCAAMGEVTGQHFVVENRPGAGGTLGTLAVARAAPDGYTIGITGAGPLAIAPTLYARLGYDPARDLALISPLWRQSPLLLVRNELPARTVPELFDLLRRNPGRYQYGHGGLGTTMHLAVELLKARTGIELDGVAYSGPHLLLDLERGRVQVAVSTFAGAIATVREGKIRALAVTSPDRNPAAPDTPALAEFLPGFDITIWDIVIGPVGLPAGMVERMRELMRQALDRSELAQRLEQIGFTRWPINPAELAAYRAEQAALLAPIIHASGARVE